MKIRVCHDVLNPDVNLRKKIKYIQFVYKTVCSQHCECKCSNKCKYARGGHKLEKIQVAIRQFFKYRLNIELPGKIWFCTASSDLSGTVKCPFSVPRIRTCYDCVYSTGYDICCNNARTKLIKDGKYKECVYESGSIKCKLFELDVDRARFNVTTGKRIIKNKDGVDIEI